MAKQPIKPTVRARELGLKKWGVVAAMIAGIGSLLAAGVEIWERAGGYGGSDNQNVVGVVQIQQVPTAPVVQSQAVRVAPSLNTNPKQIVLVQPLPPRQVPMPFQMAKLNSGGSPIRLRAAPERTAATLLFVESNHRLFVSERIGDWWYAKLDTGQTGYIDAQYVSLIPTK